MDLKTTKKGLEVKIPLTAAGTFTFCRVIKFLVPSVVLVVVVLNCKKVFKNGR